MKWQIAFLTFTVLVAAPLAAQRRPTTLSIGYTDTKFESDSRHHYNGLTLGIGVHLAGPIDLGVSPECALLRPAELGRLLQ